MSKPMTCWECDICKRLHIEEEDADKCCQPSKDEVRTKYCAGCYNDYYNTSEPHHCWLLGNAKVILRKEVHINDRPPWKHVPKMLPDCYRKPKYVYPRGDQTC